MKIQKPQSVLFYLCEALLESDQNGINVINELEKEDLLTAYELEKFNFEVTYPGRWGVCSLTALHIAVWKGRIKCLTRLLVVENVNPNVKDNHGKTPLHVAVKFCSSKLVMECLKVLVNTKNIDINAQDIDGKTVLMCAILNSKGWGSLESVTFLLSQPKIDITVEDEDGYTALTWVIHGADNFLEAAKIVIDWLIERLKNGTLDQLVLTDITKLPRKQIERFKEALKGTTRLEKVSYDDFKFGWKNSMYELLCNYSIIGFVNKITSKKWVLDIMERNRKARINCFEASVQTFLIFKRKLNKDMGNLFASWVWETRGTKIWSF